MNKFLSVLLISFSLGQKIIIPMDQSQNDHLKAYGIAYFCLTKSINIDWLLNYRGGSFLFDFDEVIKKECRLRGVSYEIVDGNSLIDIYSTIDQNNMDIDINKVYPNPDQPRKVFNEAK